MCCQPFVTMVIVSTCYLGMKNCSDCRAKMPKCQNFRAQYLIFAILTGLLIVPATCLPCVADDAATVELKKKWKKLIQEGNLNEIHKDYTAASRRYHQALPLAESIGKGSPELIESLARQAVLYLLVGNDREAEWAYRRLIDSEWTDPKKIQGMQAAAAALDDLAETYERVGTSPLRVEFLLHALLIRERMATNHPAIVDNCLLIAKYFNDKKDSSKAIDFQFRAAGAAESTPNFSTKRYCALMIRLASMYMFSQRFKESIATLEKLLAKAKYQRAMISGQESLIHRMIGRNFYGLHDYAQSEAQYKLALQKEPSPISSSVIFTNVRLAETYFRWGKKEKAKQCIERAEALSRQGNLRMRDPEVARLKKLLAEIKEQNSP